MTENNFTPNPEFLRCMECVINDLPYIPKEDTKDTTPKGIRELIDLVVDEKFAQPLDTENTNASTDQLSKPVDY